MEYRDLGRTGMRVSRICLGTMTFGSQNTEAEGHAQMDMAFDHGVNFLDTAELYSFPRDANTQGNSERIVGSWIKARGNAFVESVAPHKGWDQGDARRAPRSGCGRGALACLWRHTRRATGGRAGDAVREGRLLAQAKRLL